MIELKNLKDYFVSTEIDDNIDIYNKIFHVKKVTPILVIVNYDNKYDTTHTLNKGVYNVVCQCRNGKVCEHVKYVKKYLQSNLYLFDRVYALEDTINNIKRKIFGTTSEYLFVDYRNEVPIYNKFYEYVIDFKELLIDNRQIEAIELVLKLISVYQCMSTTRLETKFIEIFIDIIKNKKELYFNNINQIINIMNISKDAEKYTYAFIEICTYIFKDIDYNDLKPNIKAIKQINQYLNNLNEIYKQSKKVDNILKKIHQYELFGNYLLTKEEKTLEELRILNKEGLFFYEYIKFMSHLNMHDELLMIYKSYPIEKYNYYIIKIFLDTLLYFNHKEELIDLLLCCIYNHYENDKIAKIIYKYKGYLSEEHLIQLIKYIYLHGPHNLLKEIFYDNEIAKIYYNALYNVKSFYNNLHTYEQKYPNELVVIFYNNITNELNKYEVDMEYIKKNIRFIKRLDSTCLYLGELLNYMDFSNVNRKQKTEIKTLILNVINGGE